MKLVPETRDALVRLGETSEKDLVAAMVEAAEILRAVVPSCVGVSYSLLDEHLTFTVVATRRETDELEALRRPQEERRQGRAPVVDVLDEQLWREQSTVAAEHGVRSTLTVPVVANGALVGTVSVYAGEPAAFDGREERVADAVGGSATDRTANADLAFRSLQEASSAPARLDERQTIDRAVGAIGSSERVPVDAARRMLVEDAERTGITAVQAARTVLRSQER
ncbi:GAF domain-containing protein [Cellulomonas terrae]|uniref:GAF domain-containing protein n=1 Tax=Cellulomonas terrae TaxID=311234 RepID=A0A511JHJ8_9CELL|nr:GAF domain-containing protein [Cellulomonas terrae]GEL97471.1 hypothetical protein CTE05_10180 [Cellulomonas terrae]